MNDKELKTAKKKDLIAEIRRQNQEILDAYYYLGSNYKPSLSDSIYELKKENAYLKTFIDELLKKEREMKYIISQEVEFHHTVNYCSGVKNLEGFEDCEWCRDVKENVLKVKK